MDEMMRELVALLRHGCSEVLVREYGRIVYLECTPLWVELYLPRRLRMSSLLYGCREVGGFVRALPDGRYGWQELQERYQRSRCHEQTGAAEKYQQNNEKTVAGHAPTGGQGSLAGQAGAGAGNGHGTGSGDRAGRGGAAGEVFSPAHAAGRLSTSAKGAR
jgi:hypothetical protein